MFQHLLHIEFYMNSNIYCENKQKVCFFNKNFICLTHKQNKTCSEMFIMTLWHQKEIYLNLNLKYMLYML